MMRCSEFRQRRVRRIPRRLGRPGAFTFIEVLVVMIILALIAGIVGTQLLGEAEKAKVGATKIQMKALQTSLELYRLHNSTYPSSEQGLIALMQKPEVGIIPRQWQGPYLNSNNLPTDGWRNPFAYLSSGQEITIVSFGADGVEGGTELNADISSKEL